MTRTEFFIKKEDREHIFSLSQLPEQKVAAVKATRDAAFTSPEKKEEHRAGLLESKLWVEGRCRMNTAILINEEREMIWRFMDEDGSYLISRLLTLVEEIAEVHNKLKEIQ